MTDYEKSKRRYWQAKLKKEVIQPQVPLRLPCDDLTHLTEPGFDLPKKDKPHPDPARVV